MYNNMADAAGNPHPRNEILKPASNSSNSRKFTQYLQSFYYKNDNDHEPKEKTNTRIADKTMGITGGTYHIPVEAYSEFLSLYYHEIFLTKKHEFLTEKQLESGGPILIDLDFRYDISITQRQHTKEHVIDLICLILDELKTMYQPDDSAHIPFFVFEKAQVNRIQGDGTNSVTKDGIHMIIGLQSDPTVQTILRERLLAKIADVWSDLPLKNGWEDVFDASISKGHTNWQLVGSRKPGHEPYELVYVFDTFIDLVNGETNMPEIRPAEYLSDPVKFQQLSARYRNHPVLFMSNTFIQEYQAKKGKTGPRGSAGGGAASAEASAELATLGRMVRSLENGPTASSDVLKIRNQEELDLAVEYFLESLSPTQFELREAYEYTMALPKSYYGPGSFPKWIRVGWALRNIHPSLFLVWVAFSAQSETFSFSNIRGDLWERWSGFHNKEEAGLTKRSIMYWVQQENPDSYRAVKEQSLEYFIDQTLENCAVFANSSDRRGGGKGSGDYDIATVLYQLFRDFYVCVSVKANIWYKFNGTRWEEIDSGTTLRKAISEELRGIYTSKMQKLMRQLNQLKSQESEDNAPKVKSLQIRMDTLRDIIQRLAKTNDKKNIMVEAKELFFNPIFLQKLDNNPYLLCFSNGVVDFTTKEFRSGKPEDYLSKCTNIPYVPLDPVRDQVIISEVSDFMHKLFPDKELHTYMWDFLASTLIGNNLNQTFNMFIGVGQNGKSVLITLMEQVLGDYKGDVPLTLLTQQRTKIGGLAPELVMLKGTRLAVMQEPSKGDRINEGIMKQVTGGDPIQARAPYMPQMVTFVPQFKLVVCSNYFMEICSQDHGTRRRIRVVDFESLFTENPVTTDPEKPHQYKLDKKIKEKFDVWKTVFAAMLVEHAFTKNGNVHDCARVMTSSNSYLDRQDIMGEFMTETMEHCETSCVQKQMVAARFKDWHSINYNGKVPNIRELADAITKRFGKLDCGVWRGVRFKNQNSVHSGGYSDDGSIHTNSIMEGTEMVNLEEL